MRLWTIHPKYLDSKGLVALWRETLLAKKVLDGNTHGYKNHPQLDRFKTMIPPSDYINVYLSHVYAESVQRGYNFDNSKFETRSISQRMTVTEGQFQYEWKHLMGKLEKRDPAMFLKFRKLTQIDSHPIFKIIPGEIAAWEKIAPA